MLRISLLGDVVITENGEPLGRFRSYKALAVFLYLAYTGLPQQRERLADLFWDASSSEQALSNLRNALYYIRQRLASYVEADQTTLAFNPQSPHWLDTDTFRRHVEAVPDDGPMSPLAAAHLEKAFELYRGDFLADFRTDGAPRFHEWMLVEQERWRRKAITGLQRLLDFYREQGNYSAGVQTARRWLSIDNLDETAHVTLMRLLALDGQRAGALAQYETCRQILSEELGIEPHPSTTALYNQIEAGELTERDVQKPDSPAGDAVVTEATTFVPHNLPRHSTEFVGREEELAALEKALADTRQRLITITGAGGMGKTRLALATAARQLSAVSDHPSTKPRFPQGITFISLASSTRPRQVVEAMAETLRVSLRAGSRAPRDQLLDFLRPRQTLLILDNVEQLLDRREALAELLRAILRRAPGVHLLATSRESLEMKEEQALAIDGLAAAPQSPAVAQFHYPAVRLFLQSARRVQPDYTITEDDLVTVSAICRRLGGMPLAIELAASWCDALSLDDIATEIRTNLDFFEGGHRALPPRQRSMRALFNSSWQQLSEDERTLFQRLALFRDGFTYDAAHTVTGAGRPALARLVKKSLLQYRPSDGRYQMHTLLRQYAAEKLEAHPGEETAMRDRMCRYYCSWLAEQKEALTGHRQQQAAAAIDADLENVRASWNWAVQTGDAQQLYKAVRTLNYFYSWRGYHLAAARSCARAAEALADAGTAREIRTLAKIVGWQAQYALYFGDVPGAQQFRTRMADLLDDPRLEDLDTRDERAFLLREQGKSLRKTDLQASRRAYEQSKALYEELGDRWNVTMTMSWLQELVIRSGDLSGGISILKECLALQENMGDRRGATFSLIHLSALAQRQGKQEQALRQSRQALAYARQIDELPATALALHELGHGHLQTGAFAQARERFGQSLDVSRQAGNYIFSKDNLLHLGRAALAEQAFVEAEGYFRQALELSEELSYRPTVADAIGLIGLTRLYGGHPAEAQTELKRAVALCKEINYAPGLSNWRGALAIAHLHAGRRAAACDEVRVMVEERDAVLARLALMAFAEGDADATPERLEELLLLTGDWQTRYRLHEHLQALALAGVVATRLDWQDEAWSRICRACQEALTIAAFVPLLYALAGLSLLLAKQQQPETALRVGALLKTHPFVARSRWFAMLLDERLQTAAETLPAPSAAAAQAAGRGADLWDMGATLLETLGRR